MSRKQLIYIGLILVMTVIASATYFSYAFFTRKDEQHGKLNIVAGKLDYKLEILGYDGNTINSPADSTMAVYLKITNLNDFSTGYVISYDAYNQDFEVYYDSREQENPTQGTLPANGTKTILVIIENSEDRDCDVTFLAAGGFIDKGLNTINNYGFRIAYDYQTSTLSDLIFAAFPQDQITTMPSGSASRDYLSNSSHDRGLYRSYDTDSGNPTYFFRGDVQQENWVKFADNWWRIVRINEDGTIRLILEDAIDQETYVYASNNSKYLFEYKGSNAQSVLEDWYDDNIGYDPYYAQMVATPNYHFCDSSWVTESTAYMEQPADSLTPAANYYPTFKCSDDLQATGRINSKIGLITYDELIFAGYQPGWDSVANQDFDSFLYKSYDYFTMTPAGITSGNYFAYIWVAQNSFSLFPVVTDSDRRLRPVINLKADIFAYTDMYGRYIVY